MPDYHFKHGMFIMKVLLTTLTLFSVVNAPHGQKDVIDQLEKWNYREGAGKVNILRTHSITGTLEKWGNEIFREGKYILMYQPQILLPDYTGIRPFAEALDNFLRDINSIKKRLGELNDRLENINKAFIRKKLYMAPRNPATLRRRMRIYPKWQEKLTHPPHRPSSVKRRVYVRRRRVKA